jgi:hypothetical protein
MVEGHEAAQQPGDVAAESAAALERAESGDDATRLAAIEEVHAALEQELERPGNEPTRA